MLDRKKKYLQIALNSNLEEAKKIIDVLPVSDRIILEAGTPLIKQDGAQAIKRIRDWWAAKLLGLFTPRTAPPDKIGIVELFKIIRDARQSSPLPRPSTKTHARLTPYIVADLKAMDRGQREVEIALRFGASAVTALGSAPVETLNTFIEYCGAVGLDAMIDMMNVPQPVKVLRKLKKLPPVVILHRGVDEEKFNSSVPLPIHQINKLKGSFNLLISIAGGDTTREVQSSVFNGADIVVVWKDFYQPTADSGKLAEEFLKEIK